MPDSNHRRSGFIRHFFSAWTWRMAWRDSRTHRKRLALFSCSIVLGIAALAAIGSLGGNLEQAIEEQTKALLGADLVITSRDAFTPEEDRWLQGLGGEQSREVSFSSMIFLPRTEGTRLAQVRALSGGFPYYGKLETEPAKAAADFRHGGGALVEETLLRQFGAKTGDNIRVGKLTTPIVGRLEKVPGETVALSTIAPRVYISMDDLPRTGLMQEASLARYRTCFKFGPGIDVPKLVERIRPQLEKFRLGHDTVEERKRELGRSMDNLYHFLNLVGFVALLLGGVGIASAIHVHVKQKLGTVAVLRCLGGSVAQTFAVYLAQSMALGLFGAVLGAALGVAIQTTLPKVLADFIPFTFQFHTAWLAVGRAMAIGFVICLLFALLPLLTVRRVSPLAAIRVSFEPARARRDPLRWLVGACLAAGVVGFALTQSRNWRIGLGFAGGLGLAFGILAVTAMALVSVTRRLVAPMLPFTARQGLANLHRPDNRTLMLVLSLGLGTFLMMSLYLVQQTLLKQLVTSTGPNQPNAVLFDIQNAQKDDVVKLVRSLNVPVLDETPIVTMRLSSVKGLSVESILATTNRARRGHGWAFRREYRSTYRDRLRDGEKIIAGRWIGQVTNDAATGLFWWGETPGKPASPLSPRWGERTREPATGQNSRVINGSPGVSPHQTNSGEDGSPGVSPHEPPKYGHSSREVPVSLEQGIAKDLQVGLSDKLVFDVQGVPITTRVASLREVEWRRIQPNFFVVFPKGVLESAPAMHVLVTHVASSEESARMQREVVKAFPNVSAIDLTLVLQTVDAILGKISFVIRFLAMFTVLTGLLVLVTALLTGRSQRIQESVLLRTLGASRGQIFKILLVEYFALGLLAALTGILLAVLAAGALARFVFHTSLAPEAVPLVMALLIVPGITVITGFLMSRGVLNQPPLAILRAEG
jgi:putative ABC transport system permease protein